MRTYYIVLENNHTISWRIRNTSHDMNTSEGLQNIIKEYTEEMKAEVVITYWRELDV